MKFSVTILMIFCLACVAAPAQVYGQKKTEKKKAEKAKKEETGNENDKDKKEKPVFIIKKEEPKDPHQRAYEQTLKMMHGKKDTLADSPKTIAGKKGTKPEVKKGVEQKEKSFVKEGEACSCVTFKAESQDVLEQDVYITYRFRLHNKCKEGVWVNTSSFGYRVFNPDGKPTRVLRKLSFVKRYNYPEFVMLPPESEYEFKFSDDAFFEYDLRRALDYQFRFYFSNTTKKASMNGLNYLCVKEARQMVHIK